MRRAIVSNMMTLDGFLEGPKHELDWHVVEPEFFAYAGEMLRSTGIILFGRRTYEMMAAYWPTAARDEIADRMNNLPKAVFSRTLAEAKWNNSTLVRGEAAAEVRRLKQESGEDLVVLGSAELASSLLRAGLIDEYRVLVNPVILGAGKPMFPGFEERVPLRLSGVREFHSGVAMLSYRPA